MSHILKNAIAARSMVFVSAMILVASANAAGKPKVISVTNADNGKVFSAHSGDTIVVTLQENPSTGMILNYLDPGTGILKLQSKRLVPSANKRPAPGTPNTVRYTFLVGAVNPGANFSQGIRFVPARAYGKEVIWQNMFAVDIKVGK